MGPIQFFTRAPRSFASFSRFFRLSRDRAFSLIWPTLIFVSFGEEIRIVKGENLVRYFCHDFDVQIYESPLLHDYGVIYYSPR